MSDVKIECDLRELFGRARDQGARPTCLAFAASDAHAAARPDWVPLSCEYAYFHALQREGGTPDSGATLPGMMAALREDGQPPESAWAYLPVVPADPELWKPPANAGPLYRRASVSDSGSLDAIYRCLDKGAPVIITMSISDAFFLPDENAIIDAGEPADPHRRHAVIATGYGTRAGKTFILIRNSWGTAWGIEGYAWISETYIEPRLYGFTEIKEDLTNVSADRDTENMRSGVV